MDKKIVLLSGMPASGKDTITERICKLNLRYVPIKKFRSIDVNDSIKDTYYNISKEEFREKIMKKDFVQYHERYGRYYGIDKEVLLQLLKEDKIPIIHIGRIENYYSLCEGLSDLDSKYDYSVEIIHILLWETKDVLFDRINNREEDTVEIEKRRLAMEQEFSDNISLMKSGERPYTYIIKNSDIDVTCKKIFDYVENISSSPTGYEAFYKYMKTI